MKEKDKLRVLGRILKVEKYEWYIANQNIHLGVIRHNFKPGDPLKSDGQSGVVFKQQHYEVPSIAGAISHGWFKKASPEESREIDAGTYKPGELKVPDSSDKILENRLKDNDLEAVGSQSQQQMNIKDARTKVDEDQRGTAGIPKNWDFNKHWRKRKGDLQNIDNVDVLYRIKKHYRGQTFEKYVDARIRELTGREAGVIKDPSDVIGGEIKLSSQKEEIDTMNKVINQGEETIDALTGEVKVSKATVPQVTEIKEVDFESASIHVGENDVAARLANQ